MKYKVKTDCKNRILLFSMSLFPLELKQAVMENAMLRDVGIKQAFIEAACLWLQAHGAKVPKFYKSGEISQEFTGHNTVGEIRKGKRV